MTLDSGPREIQVPELLCGHGVERMKSSSRDALCSICGSFWDLKALRKAFDYNASYGKERSHAHPEVVRQKQKSLEGFLRAASLQIQGRTICEVGFGSGATLQWLRSSRAGRVYGIEAVSENMETARNLGHPPGDLFFAAERLPDLEGSVDLWLFLDSFEHLPDPSAFLEWMAINSQSNAEVLVVAPQADAPSSRLMGSLWVHRTPDHLFHWSSSGIDHIFGQAGFSLIRSFYPAKYLSLRTLIAHLFLLVRRPSWVRILSLLPPISFHFNIGEMGRVYRFNGSRNSP